MEKVKNAWLKGLRAEYGLTQAKMAEKIGISERAYQDIEAGKRDMKISLAKKIKEVFSLATVEGYFF